MSIVKVLVAATVKEIKLFNQASTPILQGCLMSSPGLLTKVIGMALDKVQRIENRILLPQPSCLRYRMAL